MATANQYYDHTNYLNCVYGMNITAENYFVNMLLQGDSTRAVYASNSFALRKRVSNQVESSLPIDNLSLPFLNYKIKDVSPSLDRKWWNNDLNVGGLYIPELEKQFPLVPVTISYEATLWHHRNDDLMFAHSLLLLDDSNETRLLSNLTIDGQEVPNPAVLGYNFGFDTTYDQNDWLEKNKIHDLSFDFEFQTFMVYNPATTVSLSEEIIFNFVSSKNLNSGDPISSDPQELLTIYFSEE